MWQLRDKKVERSRRPGTCRFSPALLLLLSLSCTKHKTWALLFANRSFNLLYLLKLSLGWIQGAKDNPQVFCRARMALQVLRPHSPEDLVGPPHCKALGFPLISGTILFIFSLQHSQCIFFAVKPFQSFHYQLSHLGNSRSWWLVMSWQFFSRDFSEI